MTDTSFEDDESSRALHLLALFFKRRYIEEEEGEAPLKKENDYDLLYCVSHFLYRKMNNTCASLCRKVAIMACAIYQGRWLVA